MTSREQQSQWLKEAQQRFEAELKKQPKVTDAEFMKEYEASDKEYAVGIVLPANNTA